MVNYDILSIATCSYRLPIFLLLLQVQDSELLQCSKLVEEHLNAFVSVQKFPRLSLHLVPERQGVSLAVLNTKQS